MPITVAVTMLAAINTPAATAAKAGRNLKPRRKAMAQPVQAPVMGRGKATKKVRAINPKFSCFWMDLLRVRANSQVKNLSPMV